MLHALVAAATLLPVAKPIRSLVYTFSYKTATESGRGTIDADIMSAAPDGSLVVRLAQNVDGQPNATMAQTECAVFPNTRVVCRQQNALSPYENEIAGLLGRNFVNGDEMDDKNHWRVSSTEQGANIVADFTVTSNTNGVVAINETRDVTVGSETTHHTAAITYDMNRTVPTKLTYTDSAAGANAAIQAEFTLTSDSLKK